MLWIDVALRTVACVSAMIATLRAGSRAVYLLDHEAIGVMDGPLILPLANETNPLFELSEAFRHCVRLSMFPQYYENVRVKAIPAVLEPYPLSPLSPHGPRSREEDEHLDIEIDRMIEQVNETKHEEESRLSFLQRQLARSKEMGPWISSSVKPSIARTKEYITVAPQLATYWIRRAWYREKWSTEAESDDDDDGKAWDYEVSTKTDLHFNSTEGTPRVAELHVFAAETFSHLRSLFGISEDTYRKSIFGTGPFVSFQSNSKGAARVGGVFFFTRDGAYMIKTIKAEEAKTFLKMLPKYHRYMKRHGRKSLLTRFCGIYTVRIQDEGSSDKGELQTFVVMNSVFPAEASKFISERFDLKGSTVGREVSDEEKRTKGSHAVLKDLDLAREVELVRSLATREPTTDYGLNIGAHAKAALLSQLRHDVKLLVDCQVMDYSLLVGVVNMEAHKFDQSAERALSVLQQQERQLVRLAQKSRKVDEMALCSLTEPFRLLLSPPLFIARKVWSLAQLSVSSVVTLPLPYYGSGKCGVDGGVLSVIHGTRRGDRAVYYMGLIDFLQPWTTRKVLERQLKGIMGYDTSAISCVSPEEYATRFLEYLDAHLS